MPRRRLPKIYCDVHIKPGALEAITEVGFKYIRIPESKYRNRDEHDFIEDLYAKMRCLQQGIWLLLSAYVEKTSNMPAS